MTTAAVVPATGKQLSRIVERLQKIAAHERAPHVEQVVTAGGSGGGGTGRTTKANGSMSCHGGCTGGMFTIMSNGTLFNVWVTAPTPGTYTITGYTTDSHGNQNPIQSATVTVSESQAGPTETVNASTFVPSDTDMTNGVSITVTGPNANDNPFEAGCDTGTGAWNYSPWEEQDYADSGVIF